MIAGTYQGHHDTEHDEKTGLDICQKDQRRDCHAEQGEAQVSVELLLNHFICLPVGVLSRDCEDVFRESLIRDDLLYLVQGRDVLVGTGERHVRVRERGKLHDQDSFVF